MCDDSCTKMKCIIIYDLNVITNQWLATSSWSNQQNRIAFSKLGTSLDKIQQFPRNNCMRNNETTKTTLAASIKIVAQNTLHLLSNLQYCFAKLINVLWNLFSKKINDSKTSWCFNDFMSSLSNEYIRNNEKCIFIVANLFSHF